jgi:UDP-2,4-diacetamido-2,4,6-trideoxy-beta-L-altropyranose hydrolase
LEESQTYIYFRVDGSLEIGLGHLIRCISLAHMLKNHFQVVFLCKKIPQNSISEISKCNATLIIIKDEEETLNLIHKKSIVVFDGYNFTNSFRKTIYNIGCKIVCIDDIADKPLTANLIINHSPNILTNNYYCNPYTMFALGREYRLLRPCFLEQSKKNRIVTSIETLFISIGGADTNNFTLLILKVVLKHFNFKKIYLVTGPAYPYHETLIPYIVNNKQVEYHNSIGEEEMVKCMSNSDLAIIPASGTLYEVLAAGAIAIIGYFVENQKMFFDSFKNYPNVFTIPTFDEEEIKKAIENVFNNTRLPLHINSNNLGEVDVRYRKIFKQLELSLALSIRRVDFSDFEDTYKWASDPTIRNMSLNKHVITKDEHSQWFNKIIVNKSSFYFVVEFNGKKIGTIRFDKENENLKISYLLDSAYRGLGFGVILLANGIEEVTREIKNEITIKSLVGQVLKTNISSIKAFNRLGFIIDDCKEYFLFKKALLMYD